MSWTSVPEAALSEAALLEGCHVLAVDTDKRQHDGFKARIQQLQMKIDSRFQSTFIKPKKTEEVFLRVA